jgi:hypothetical protein
MTPNRRFFKPKLLAMKPRLLPLIAIIGLSILAGLLIHQSIREHLRPPASVIHTPAPQTEDALANEEQPLGGEQGRRKD